MTPPRGILDAWGSGTIRRPLPGGNRNSVWLVDIAGRAHVLKSTTHSEPSLAWLGEVHCRARRTGFRVPELIRAGNGRLAPGGWTLEPFLQGHPASARIHLLAQIRRFHLFTRSVPQRPENNAAGTNSGGSDVSVIHGDLNPDNILIAASLPPALIDWDEARRDATALDLVALGAPLGAAQRRDALAHEIASCWGPEPTRARRLLHRLASWPDRPAHRSRR